MIQKIFSVYDNKAEAFLPPFFCATRGQAIRMLTDAVSDPAHQFAKHPEDFALFELGTYNDANGALTSNATPTGVIICLELVKEK